MTRFEYLSVLISIVVALGLSEMLLCWVRIFRHRRQVRLDWLHGLWTVLVLLLIVEFWWGFWQFAAVPSWSFPGLMLVVVTTVVLVVVALLLTPPREEPLPASLRSYYLAQARPVFHLAALLLLLMIAVDVLVGGQPLLHPENAIRPLAAAMLGWLGFTASPRWHGTVAVTCVGLFALFMTVVFVNEGF